MGTVETIETIKVEKVAEMYNNGMSLKSIADNIGTSKSTVQRKLTKNGYILNKITKKYENNVSVETIINENTVLNKTNVSRETNKNENIVNRTYAINEKIDKAMKLKAIIEGKKPIDIVREALESYIEGKYFDM